MRPPRRAVLVAGVAALAGCTGGGHSAPSGSSGDELPRLPSAGGKVITGSFRSRQRRTQVAFRIATPTGHAATGLPVIIGLHGFGGDARTLMDLGFPGRVDDAVRAGAPPFAYVTVDGGRSSYYHRRTDGTDAGAMVLDELLPVLRGMGFATARIALHGFSMGGYGALLLATQRPSLVAAVAVVSPALWDRAADTPAVAFDSAADFAAHDVFTKVAVLQRIPLRIDVGDKDPFRPAVRRFRARFTTAPAGGVEPGGHTEDFVATRYADQFAFLGKHLASQG